MCLCVGIVLVGLSQWELSGCVLSTWGVVWVCSVNMGTIIGMYCQHGELSGCVLSTWGVVWVCTVNMGSCLGVLAVMAEVVWIGTVTVGAVWVGTVTDSCLGGYRH